MIAVLSHDFTASKAAWEPLIEALRGELQEFGGLIRLLKDEQDALFANPSQKSTVPAAIARQHNLAMASTRLRNALMIVPGPDGGHPGSSIEEILDAAPQEIRPLLDALFAEVERLAMRAGDRAIQNDWLRKRATMLEATDAGRCAAHDRVGG